MKMLVATRETQKARRNDFAFATDGEVVYFGSQCTRATPDDDCGCARAFSGVTSHKGTTTAKVVEVPEGTDLAHVIRASLVDGGWNPATEPKLTAASFAWLCDGAITQLIERFPTLKAMSERSRARSRRRSMTCPWAPWWSTAARA